MLTNYILAHLYGLLYRTGQVIVFFRRVCRLVEDPRLPGVLLNRVQPRTIRPSVYDHLRQVTPLASLSFASWKGGSKEQDQS